MKTAIYMEDGLYQVVMTPETEYEKTLVESFRKNPKTSFHFGEFYQCRGGWHRQGLGAESLIIRFEPEAPTNQGRGE